MRFRLRYVYSDIDRHGNRRFYVRVKGRKIRLVNEPGTPGFLAEHEAALVLLAQPNTREADEVTPGTLRWLATRYFASPVFLALAATSQVNRRAVIESCLREPIKPGAKQLYADCPLKVFTARHVQSLRDRRANQPGAANNRKKYLSSMFGWAVQDHEMSMVVANPVREVDKIDYASAGFKAWTEADLTQFEAYWPLGSKPRLAMALMLYTGVRRSDVVRLGPAHVRDGWLRFVPKKTDYRRKDETQKPWLPELEHIVAVSKLTGTKTFLVTDYGQPFSPAGFGNWFGERCRLAGLSDCSAHGLRKLGATRAAELGATHFQLMSIFDWRSPKEALKYIEAAERKRATAMAMGFLARPRETMS